MIDLNLGEVFLNLGRGPRGFMIDLNLGEVLSNLGRGL